MSKSKKKIEEELAELKSENMSLRTAEKLRKKEEAFKKNEKKHFIVFFWFFFAVLASLFLANTDGQILAIIIAAVVIGVILHVALGGDD